MLNALGLGNVSITQTTSMPDEEQFWQQFDGSNMLTEAGMRKALPTFITDPANLAKVQALLEESNVPGAGLPAEETRQIQA